MTKSVASRTLEIWTSKGGGAAYRNFKFFRPLCYASPHSWRRLKPIILDPKLKKFYTNLASETVVDLVLGSF